ncbi:MAG TPA: alpha/beta hydrolase [Spirochaetota bacterium]|nr:alpha/beta hydrolase [Spirochaetota bacterium]HPS87914.1 alpha/beta hydrolase [Spirochaetota bacterium]
MKEKKIQIENIPAILYGTDSERLYIFVHGKYSKKEEAENFANIAVQLGYQVISFDLPEHGERGNEPYECTAQNGVHDLKIIYSFVKNKYRSFSLYACSLGVYFSLTAYQDISFDNCLFLSPILNMERLIQNMMKWSDVSEEELKGTGEIITFFGEKLSWSYYQYVRNHPIEKWNNRTFILYGENDNLTERSVLNSFSEKYNCDVTIMDNGEHYFHTPEQLNYLENWIRKVV